ncbi:DUF1573 domain-containing protein [Pontibacter sp. BT310]|jgi:hypothetical protein|uniref:DUF1573 domain-containing protein n=1 Tax=Pontibacter populi TaxID=890055 RepID=A0ABS6X8R7_9BACT|nr:MULTISPECIES: DUF1573 domain-containing protein [Pontibacter]MBJ6117531.1 DUF1573 domain-containing protein [Pontibacter sp. BT310]MBR0569956.1 DUF1573 domain-containing protein [Microvirga sp. STS03]MBW3364384.1 DUF1573 domain-containing protein [Pontibacter populi]
MKKNLIYTFAMAVALMATSCNENTATDAEATTGNDVATTAPATETTVDNPNIATTEQTAATTTAANPNAPAMTFKETVYDFGTVKQGEVVNHTFTFTNTGKEPLIIENASASCGCTVPEWPKTPVAPGKTGEIKVQFNSTGKYGQQAPMVTIRANTEPNITQVSLKGTVEASTIPTAGAEGPVKRN